MPSSVDGNTGDDPKLTPRALSVVSSGRTEPTRYGIP